MPLGHSGLSALLAEGYDLACHAGAVVVLAAGTRLGPYEIAGLLGAGGMGEVYRAHDTRIGRDIAVKVLPAAAAGDADRARFGRRPGLPPLTTQRRVLHDMSARRAPTVLEL